MDRIDVTGDHAGVDAGTEGDGGHAGTGVGFDDLDSPRRGRTGLIVSLVVAVLALAFVWVLATRDPGTDRRADSDLVGRVAPAVAGQTLDGGSFNIDNHRGRWVVVNFFATWCGPCQQEHPELRAFDQAHSRAGDARVVSVLYDDDPGDARDFFARNGGGWPVVLDDGHIAFDYGVTGVPETYLVSPDGVVVAKLIGGVTQEGLDRYISELEGAQAAAATEGSR